MSKYRINPDIIYTVDIFDIKVSNAVLNTVTELSYHQAVIWDLLIKNYPYKSIIKMMALIGRMTATHAKAVVDDTLEFLLTENILRKE